MTFSTGFEPAISLPSVLLLRRFDSKQVFSEIELLEFLTSILLLNIVCLLTIIVARVGVEPTRPFGQGILSPPRLPFRHRAILIK